MSDIKKKKNKTWKNPLAVWGSKGGNHEVPTPEYKNPHQIWRDTKAFKVPTSKIGRFHYEYKSTNHGEKIWNRLRWWPTRRTILWTQGVYNRKTLKPEKIRKDKRPVFWFLSLLFLAIVPFILPDGYKNSLLTAGGIFGIYASINLCWTLVIGTAGIFSLATYAIVGLSAFLTTWLSINLGLPWWMLPMIGMIVGLAFGIIIALPALRLDGFYYGLWQNASRDRSRCLQVHSWYCGWAHWLYGIRPVRLEFGCLSDAQRAAHQVILEAILDLHARMLNSHEDRCDNGWTAYEGHGWPNAWN